MKTKINSLTRQLILITIILFGIITFSIGIVIPKVLLPVYEKNLFLYLSLPLEIMESDISNNILTSNVAYIYITDKGKIIPSNNLIEITKQPIEEIITNINKPSGKMSYNGKHYYYFAVNDKHISKIALTDTSYINNIRKDIINSSFPILILTFIIIVGLIVLWSQNLIRKISVLKEKIENIDNDNYIDNYNFSTDDELKVLSLAIDNMKENLKNEEDYKNQMFQNVSHDLKTPITVIKSYIEGLEDDVLDKKAGFKVIKEQVNNLEIKVHSLLYLNKLNYIKDLKDYKLENIDIIPIFKSSIEKFKVVRPDIDFIISNDNKNTNYIGNKDMWETIIDNLLHNFTRFASKTIKISIKKNEIILYNDGPSIEEDILNDIFNPYKKGVKGQFGLGLSIVKKTINFFGYNITIKNLKKGVNFIIK